MTNSYLFFFLPKKKFHKNSISENKLDLFSNEVFSMKKVNSISENKLDLFSNEVFSMKKVNLIHNNNSSLL